MMTPRKLQSLSNDEKTKDLRFLCLNHAFQSKTVIKPGFKKNEFTNHDAIHEKNFKCNDTKEKKTEVCIFYR